MTQVARNFASDRENAGRRFRFLIRDRDTAFSASFDEVFASTGVETFRTPYAERFVRTIRQEYLDHLLVVSRQHLESVLDKYVQHYNQARPHRGLHLGTANPALTCAPANRRWHRHPRTVTRLDILGGIIDECERAA